MTSLTGGAVWCIASEHPECNHAQSVDIDVRSYTCSERATLPRGSRDVTETTLQIGMNVLVGTHVKNRVI